VSTVGGSVTTLEDLVKQSLTLAAALFAAACGTDSGVSSPPVVPLSGNGIREHMQTLSSDQFMGRGPGQPGGDMAAEYIANHFRDYGLEPVGGSYLQPVPMVGYSADPATVALSFRGPGGALDAPYRDGFVLNAGDPQATSVSGSAELVFVGYGIDAPEAGWDDFGDVDVEGKFLLILVNDPPAPAEEPDLFGGPAMTYYGRWTYKWEEAARQGALGALIVHETEPSGYPWSVVRGGRTGPQFALPPDPSGPEPAGMLGWVTQEVAQGVLALGGHDFEELKAAAGRRGFAAIPTGVTASGRLTNTVRMVETANVVGLLRGSERPDEMITVTSHYDHFGVGETIDGDSIYNGAYDNASGTALLLELARVFAFDADRPARSLLFIATAAEEQGLLGAQWYVQSPLFPLSRTVAEINVDGANLWGETDDVTVQGEERSGLGVFVRARAEQLGLRIMPDAEPEKGYFFRSDHFPFAKAGVPSLYIEHGRAFRGRPEEWGSQVLAEYTAQRYHAPTDEFSGDFVFDGAVQQGTLVYLTALDIAMDETWPNWHEGQEFKAARDAMMAGR
jgi:Zn-dependent M28 family amino/carboxypeptidase